ncbi:uncharacterized protein LOC123294247 [Chrysoperla carnea]|uniref:uncharacterized protein LOC123294247 n=1 Tax=Chrysoperla carnea TaxID=189513 RepID=UPI001D0840B8|nr:uncharacterized protein LOC123294247 [Chrysoperla carnea]
MCQILHNKNTYKVSKCIIGLMTVNCLMYLTTTTKIYSQQIHDFNPIRNLPPPPPLSQRRQGYGYSASIVHYTPGDPNAQHAQSEINVNMNLNNEVRQPKITNNEINSNKKSTHFQPNPQSSSKSIKPNSFDSTKPLFHSQLPNQMQIQPQKGVLHITESKPKQVSTSLGQNSFNVGYSIGFGTQSDTPTSNVVQPPAGFMELQKFTPDIVKGTANDKVLKPAAFQSEIKPKDYVLSAMESYQKQGIQLPFAKTSPKKIDETNYNQYKYQQQYGGDDILTSSNQQTGYVSKSSKKLTSKPKHVESSIYSKQNTDNFGWKSLSPTLEVASGITNLNTAHNTNPLTVSSKHSTNGHTLVNSQSSQTHFDHAQALGHSQGFDYSNAINFENNLTPSLSNHHEQQTASAVSSVIQSTPVPASIITHQQAQQSGRSSSSVDSNFNGYQQQYQPVSLSWFNNQDAITTATTKDQLVLNNQPQPATESVKIQSNNGLSKQYSANPLPIDTRLLQPVPYLTTSTIQQPSSNSLPIYFDTSLLQKALLSNDNGQINQIRLGGLNANPSQPNSVYTLPASSNPVKPNSPPVQHQKSEVIFNSRPNSNEYHQQHHDSHKVIRQEKPESKRHYYHNHQSHVQEQRGVSDRGQTQQINHRLYQSQQSAPSMLMTASSNGVGDQHGSHSTQVNSVISPVEQVIKGKHKKPGVVRHPRVLNNDNDDDDEIMTKSSSSGSSGVHHQINARNSNVGHSKYHVNTHALRPPPMNFIIKKFSS